MDPAAILLGCLLSVLAIVGACAGLVVLGTRLEGRAGAAELGAMQGRAERAEALAAERLELVHEARELLEAQVRNDAEAQRRQAELDSIRHGGDGEAALDTPAGRAARLDAVDRLLRVARERRRPGRAPADPGPVADARAGDGRGPPGVV